MQAYIPEEWDHISRPIKSRKIKSDIESDSVSRPCMLDKAEEDYVLKRQTSHQSVPEQTDMTDDSVSKGCQHILNEIKKTDSVNALEMSQQCTLMLDGIICNLPYKDIFKKMALATEPHRSVPLVSKKYEESYMREPMHAGEKQCVMGEHCECNFIDASKPFIAVGFCPPLGFMVKDENVEHMCVICHRKMVQTCFFDALYNSSSTISSGVIQSYGNICGKVDEYSSACVLVSPPNSPLIQMFPHPIAVHQRNQYTVHDTNVRHLLQNNMGYVNSEVLGHSSQVSGLLVYCLSHTIFC
jgi:hypothetical protein